MRKHATEKYIRYTLGILLLFMAVNAFGGGYYGMSGAESVPVGWLKGTPFHNYFIPSLILFGFVGGSSLIAAIAVFKRHSLATEAVYACGVIVFVWIITQISIIGYVSWLQPAVVSAVLLILFLNWLLKKCEH